MSSGHSRRGFTLVEALAAVALIAVGVVAALNALGAMATSEGRARELEVMQRMAINKLHELTATGQATTAMSGNFEDQNDTTYQWSLEVDTTGVTDLSAVTVSVTRRDNPSGPKQTVESLQYTSSSTTSSTGSSQ